MTSYTFVKSIPALDALGQTVKRPVVNLSGGTITACDIGCSACTANTANGTVCSACYSGYFFDQSGATPKCSPCPNSLLCVWNDTMKKPQILACKINENDLSPPYSQTYFLQFDFTTDNFGDDYA